MTHLCLVRRGSSTRSRVTSCKVTVVGRHVGQGYGYPAGHLCADPSLVSCTSSEVTAHLGDMSPVCQTGHRRGSKDARLIEQNGASSGNPS